MLVTVGGFDPHNAVEGKDALFNMWDYVLSIDDLRKVNCNTKGHLLTMNNMATGGPAALSFEDVPCDRGEYSEKSANFLQDKLMMKLDFPHRQVVCLFFIQLKHEAIPNYLYSTFYLA